MSAVYPSYREALLAGAPGYDLDRDDDTDGPYAVLIDTDNYTYSVAHAFYTDLGLGVVAPGRRILTPSVLDGLFRGDDVVFPNVVGPCARACAVYRHNSGPSSSWPLVMFYDQLGSGFPLVPNGGSITLRWNVEGIFQL